MIARRGLSSEAGDEEGFHTLLAEGFVLRGKPVPGVTPNDDIVAIFCPSLHLLVRNQDSFAGGVMHLNLPLSSQHLSIGASGLSAILDAPEECLGLGVLISEKGWSRHSTLDNDLARVLGSVGMAMLIVDYLDEASAATAAGRSILLPSRLEEVFAWIEAVPPLASVPVFLVEVGDVARECSETLRRHRTRISGRIRFLPPGGAMPPAGSSTLVLAVPQLSAGGAKGNVDPKTARGLAMKVSQWLRPAQSDWRPSHVNLKAKGEAA